MRRTVFDGTENRFGGYLEGQQGAYIETRNGFDVDGVEIKCRLDFGAKAIDWRGLYKNPGA